MMSSKTNFNTHKPATCSNTNVSNLIAGQSLLAMVRTVLFTTQCLHSVKEVQQALLSNHIVISLKNHLHFVIIFDKLINISFNNQATKQNLQGTQFVCHVKQDLINCWHFSFTYILIFAIRFLKDFLQKSTAVNTAAFWWLSCNL